MSEITEAGPIIEEEEVPPEEICKKYRKISRNRPPFEYKAEKPAYPEADEGLLFAMEKRVFDLASYLPPPPDEPYLAAAYASLQIRHKTLLEGIAQVKNLDPLHEDHAPITARVGATRLELQMKGRHNDPGQLQQLFEQEKDHWEAHYKAKKLFFHQALSYLYLMEAYHPDPKEQKDCRRFRREAYAMFIGHQGTTYSRSASHELGPVRRDKQPTIKHPYTIAVHGINFWLKKINAAKDEEEEAILFHELNMEIIRDLFHDTLEDYYLTQSDLAHKLGEMLNFDLRVGTRFREADEKTEPKNERRTPENVNFAELNRETIMQELWALKEEEEDKDPEKNVPYYLERKLPQIPKKRQPQVYLSKVRDRSNNLQSPRYKTPGKTLEKIHETLKILSLGLHTYQALTVNKGENIITAQELTGEMNGLVQVCLRELARYESTNEFKGLTEENRDWIAYAINTQIQFKEYEVVLKKAA